MNDTQVEARVRATLEHVASSTLVRPRIAIAEPRRAGRRMKAAVAGAVAAAVVVAVVLAVTVVGEHGRPRPSTTDETVPDVVPGPGPAPRFVIDDPAWRILNVSERDLVMERTRQAAAAGSVGYQNGTARLDLGWQSAGGTAEETARLRVAGGTTHAAATVVGRPGFVVSYPGTAGFSMLWQHGTWMFDLRVFSLAGVEFDVDQFLQLTTRIREVSEQDWLAQLPASLGVVAGDARGALTRDMLAAAQAPSGFDRAPLLGSERVITRADLGRTVATAVVCAWSAAWDRATSRDDRAGMQRAIDGVAAASTWPFVSDPHFADVVLSQLDGTFPVPGRGYSTLELREHMCAR